MVIKRECYDRIPISCHILNKLNNRKKHVAGTLVRSKLSGGEGRGVEGLWPRPHVSGDF